MAKHGKSSRLSSSAVKGEACLTRLRKAVPMSSDKDPLEEITVRIDNKIVSLTEMTEIMESLLKYMDMAADTAGIPVAKQVLHFVLFHIKAFLLIKRIRSADKLSEALYGMLLIQNFTVRRIVLEETLLAYPRLIILGGAKRRSTDSKGEVDKPPVDLLSKILIRDRKDLLILLTMFNVLKLDARSTDVEFDGPTTIIERIRAHYSSINKLEEFKQLEVELRKVESLSDQTKDTKELLETLSMENERARREELQARFKVVKDWIFLGGEGFDVIHFILHNNEFQKMAILFTEAGITLDTSPSFQSVTQKTVRQRIKEHGDQIGGLFSQWIPTLEKLEQETSQQNEYHLPLPAPAMLHLKDIAGRRSIAQNDEDEQEIVAEYRARVSATSFV
jgi:hypothetical protein